MTPDDVIIWERKFLKLKVDMPIELSNLIIDAENFSKHLRKKLHPLLGVENRLTVDQLETLNS